MARFLGRTLLLALLSGAGAALLVAVRRARTMPPTLDRWPVVPRNPAAPGAAAD